jgi:hypothetical protein
MASSRRFGGRPPPERPARIGEPASSLSGGAPCSEAVPVPLVQHVD